MYIILTLSRQQINMKRVLSLYQVKTEAGNRKYVLISFKYRLNSVVSSGKTELNFMNNLVQDFSPLKTFTVKDHDKHA